MGFLWVPRLVYDFVVYMQQKKVLSWQAHLIRLMLQNCVVKFQGFFSPNLQVHTFCKIIFFKEIFLLIYRSIRFVRLNFSFNVICNT